MGHKFKTGDIARCVTSGMIYKITGSYIDDSDGEWFYKVDILEVGTADYYRTGLENFPVYSCDPDELAIGYKAAKQFDDDLEDLLNEES